MRNKPYSITHSIFDILNNVASVNSLTQFNQHNLNISLRKYVERFPIANMKWKFVGNILYNVYFCMFAVKKLLSHVSSTCEPHKY